MKNFKKPEMSTVVRIAVVVTILILVVVFFVTKNKNVPTNAPVETETEETLEVETTEEDTKEETETEDDIESFEESIPVVEETTELETKETESEVHTFEETTAIESSETQTTETEIIVPETTTVEPTEATTTVTETTQEQTETPTTTVPETTTVAPTEESTTVAETTPKYTEYIPVGGWSNEKEAHNIGEEIQNSNGLSQNPIRILDNSASFGDSTPVITISKNGNGYDLTIKTRIQANSTSQGLKAICMLTGISGLYDTIYDAYEGSNSNGINYDTPVTIGGHSYIATNNGSNMVFHIQ